VKFSGQATTISVNYGVHDEQDRTFQQRIPDCKREVFMSSHRTSMKCFPKMTDKLNFIMYRLSALHISDLLGWKVRSDNQVP
jgi:hypothetical protein